MRKFNPALLIFALVTVFPLLSCSKAQYMPVDRSVAYMPTDSVNIYWEKPNLPYKEIGILSAEGSDLSEEELLDLLKEKARSVGAHGVIMKPSGQRSRTIGIPGSVGGTTLAPRAITTQLHGIAIRFDEPPILPQAKPPKEEQILKPKTLPVEKIDKSTSAPSDRYRLTVIGTFANIRTGAGNDFPILTIVKRGDKLILLGEYEDWFHVRLENGQEGWIHNKFAKEE
jgi:hypothetical protein